MTAALKGVDADLRLTGLHQLVRLLDSLYG
jgi:hypothetical protein